MQRLEISLAFVFVALMEWWVCEIDFNAVRHWVYYNQMSQQSESLSDNNNEFCSTADAAAAAAV